jgi:hypothetical protein
MTHRRLRLLVWTAAAIAFLIQPAAAQQEQSKTAAGAKELVQLLDQAKLDSIAAPLPDSPDIFVAAMSIPGELLVISAKYSAPSLLTERINKKDYREVYIDLNSAGTPNTKVFIQDLGADGLVLKPSDDDPHDIYESTTTKIEFSGDWKKMKMSEEDYRKAFAQADAEYAKYLSALIAQVKKSGT